MACLRSGPARLRLSKPTGFVGRVAPADSVSPAESSAAALQVGRPGPQRSATVGSPATVAGRAAPRAAPRRAAPSPAALRFPFLPLLPPPALRHSGAGRRLEMRPPPRLRFRGRPSPAPCPRGTARCNAAQAARRGAQRLARRLAGDSEAICMKCTGIRRDIAGGSKDAGAAACLCSGTRAGPAPGARGASGPTLGRGSGKEPGDSRRNPAGEIRRGLTSPPQTDGGSSCGRPERS
jgi:hypothetical protein